MIQEGYDRVGVSEGCDFVLQSIKYLTGDAEKWWRSIVGAEGTVAVDVPESCMRIGEEVYSPQCL